MAIIPARAANAPRQPKKTIADRQRNVAHIRAWQHLCDGKHFDELRASQPAPLLDQHALRDRDDATETLECQQGERDEQFFFGSRTFEDVRVSGHGSESSDGPFEWAAFSGLK